MIVEILSLSTATYDRTVKFEHYRQMESLSNYILIEQEQVLVEHFHRDASGVWQQQIYARLDDLLYLTELELGVPLGEIYERLALVDGSVLAV